MKFSFQMDVCVRAGSRGMYFLLWVSVTFEKRRARLSLMFFSVFLKLNVWGGIG